MTFSDVLRRLEWSCKDIAIANLVCSEGLPGEPKHSVDWYINWLDGAAEQVKLATDRNYYKYLESPYAFEGSQARFCMVCLVSVMQRQLGVQYNPKWKGLKPDGGVPATFGIDANDVFIHAIINGVGGTCGSLPVLYVAIGRRLRYPLKLVKAARHLFVRWDDPYAAAWHCAERFNVEATGPGVHFLPDEHYRVWPHAISDRDVEEGVFLRSLSKREELAEFTATRAHCLRANNRLIEAVDALAEAARLAPHNRYFAASRYAMRMHIDLHRRGHAFLNAPVPGTSQEPVGPFWLDGPRANECWCRLCLAHQRRLIHDRFCHKWNMDCRRCRSIFRRRMAIGSKCGFQHKQVSNQ